MCTAHRTVHRLSSYMNIPKYSKLFIQIIRETSVQESDCTGNVLSGKRLSRKRLVWESDCPGNVRYPFYCTKYIVATVTGC